MTRRGRHSRRSPTAGTLALALAVVLVSAALVIVALPSMRGGAWRTVETGSMEPHVSAGDVVLVVPGTGTPVIGEIIAFPDPLRPERDVLHRVVAIDDRGGLVTRGDANDVDDPWSVSPSDVIGVEVLTVPRLGFVVSAVTSDVGIFLFLVVPALLILISESKVWYRFIRHGRAAFEARSRGRHLPSRRLAESET